MAKPIEGLDQLVENLLSLPKELAGKSGGPIRVGLAACAKVIRDDARQRAPYNEEGIGKHLRDEIIMKRDPNPRANGGAAERYIVTVRSKDKKYANNKSNRRKGRVGSKFQNFGDFFYWRYQEFGTSRMKPKPFLRPAFEANKGALADIFVAKCSAGIAKIVQAMKK